MFRPVTQQLWKLGRILESFHFRLLMWNVKYALWDLITVWIVNRYMIFGKHKEQPLAQCIHSRTLKTPFFRDIFKNRICSFQKNWTGREDMEMDNVRQVCLSISKRNKCKFVYVTLGISPNCFIVHTGNKRFQCFLRMCLFTSLSVWPDVGIY